MQLPSLIINSPVFDFEGKGSNLKSAVFYLLLMATLFVPLSAELPVTPSLRFVFPLELLVPLAALLILAGMCFYRNGFRFVFFDYAVLFFLCAAGLSAIFSVIPLYSFKALAVLCSYATTFYLGFRWLNLKDNQWEIVWRILVIAFLALMLYTLFRYFHLGIHRKHSYEMSLPFVPGHTLLVAIGFPAFLYCFNRVMQKTAVRLDWFFTLLFLFVAAISYSRIYWVVILLSVFVLLFSYYKKIRLIMIVAGVLLLAIGGIAYHRIDEKRDRERAWDNPDDHNSLFVQIQSIFVWEKNESNMERSNRWKVAKKIFRAHPVTGAGLNTYPEIYFWYKDTAKIEETNLSCVKMNAHQIYTGWLAEMGLAGFIAGITLLLSFLSLVIRLRGSPGFILALLLFLNFVLLGIIEDFTTLPRIMSVFWISMGYVVYLAADKTHAAVER